MVCEEGTGVRQGASRDVGGGGLRVEVTLVRKQFLR